MQGQHLVVDIPCHEIGDRAGQFGSDGTSEGSTNEIKQEAAHQILQADHLVVDAEAQVTQPSGWLQPRGGDEGV